MNTSKREKGEGRPDTGHKDQGHTPRATATPNCDDVRMTRLVLSADGTGLTLHEWEVGTLEYGNPREDFHVPLEVL